MPEAPRSILDGPGGRSLVGIEAGKGLALGAGRVSSRWWFRRGLNYRLRRELPVLGRVPVVRDALEIDGRVGLRLSTDVAGYLPRGDVPEPGTRFEVRRAFVYTTGELRLVYPILYKLSVGGVGDELYWDDLYLWAREVPVVGTLQLGQFNAPMSLELLSGSSQSQFMEYGAPVQAFAASLKVGLQAHDDWRDGRATWAIGLFTDGQSTDVGDDTNSPLRAVGRLTGLAIDPGDGDGWLLHLGASASVVLSASDRVRYRSRPESYLAPYLVDTGDIRTSSAFPWGVEIAATRGPFTAQAEWLGSVVEAEDGGVLRFTGGYFYAGWVLTGERRRYDRSNGRFAAPLPRVPFGLSGGGWGAWEVAARFSWTDLGDGPVRGGRMAVFTGGLNWTWNRWVRVIFDAQLARTWDGAWDGRLGILQARLQLEV